MNIRDVTAGVLLCVLFCGAASADVTGVVRDLNTLAPLPDAIVTLQATAVRTTTAADGTFTLAAPDGADLVIVGAKKGYFNAGILTDAPAAGIEILLEPVPQDDDPNYEIQDPGACGFCHPDQHQQWTDTPMARAGINTWVYDIYNGTGTPGGMGGFVYTRDSVHAEDNPESECSSCHQPESWIAEPHSALVDINDLTEGALHGVACDVCHKIADVDVSQINTPGIYPGAVTFTRPAGPDFDQVQYGLLGDSTYEFDIFMRASYNPQLAAEVCGTCHQDANDPDGNGDFTEPNSVISEPTYLEWLASPYADPDDPLYATCVDCHMPSSGQDQACNQLDPPLLRDPSTLRSHVILGTTPEYLENAVELTLDVQNLGDELAVQVDIFNHATGHHVPTGVTIRNMILLVRAWREEDGYELPSTGTQVVHDLGGIGDPAEGYYAGVPGKYFSKVNHDANGNGPTFFTDATGITFDNRIPALGTDTSNYSFTVPGNGGTLKVEAKLIYRRGFRFLVDAKQWQYDGHGNPLADVTPPHYGHVMEIAEDTIPLPFTEPTFRRGDFDGDGMLMLADGVDLLNYLFLAGAPPVCPDAADSDDNGTLEIADPIHLLSYLYVAGSPPPPDPGPDSCGEDPSDDSLLPCGDSFCF